MTLSNDGRWWWDGQRWVAAVSPDGAWRWDGTAWRPAGPGTSAAPAPIKPFSFFSHVFHSIFSLGAILAGAGAGAALWLPTHDVTACAKQGAIVWVGLVAVRLIDPLLAPLWRLLRRIPGVLRMAATLGVAVWYSIQQFGPSANDVEISRFQAALLISIAVAYLLLRPGRGGFKAPA